MKIHFTRFSLLVALFSSICFNAQNEFSKWYFGFNGAALDFSTTPPTTLTISSLNMGNCGGTICDSGGNLLFFTTGSYIVNSALSLMANGSPLNGHPSATQSGMIVKQPGNSNLYYVFSLSLGGGGTGQSYSIVDMNLAAGLGSVTVKNQTLYAPSTEKQVAVRHCNGKDVWIVSHEHGTNNFRAYLLTAAGLNTVGVISSVGDLVFGGHAASTGQMKVSPDGKKLALATMTAVAPPANPNAWGFYLFDFDAATGVVSNSLSLNGAANAFGVEFSSDGTKLYGSVNSQTSAPSYLYQWNVCAGSNSAILASQYSVNINYIYAGTLQRGIDGKIYLVIGAQQALSVINNPNSSGAAMGFSLNSLSIAPKSDGFFPNFINPYTRPSTPTPFSNTIACNFVQFAPVLATFSSGCSSTPYPPQGYKWDFGEPSSGAANTSTVANTTHMYAATGTYTVSLIQYNTCTNDTIKKVITINTIGPNPAVSGTMDICKGDRYTYTVTGGSSYSWSAGSTTSTQALNPSQTTSYTVSASQNGCSLSKTFTVNVAPCTGLEALGSTNGVRLYPNPFNDLLNIEVKEACRLELYDVNGRMVFEAELVQGSNHVNTEHLKVGVYFVKAQGTNLSWRGKLVKVE